MKRNHKTWALIAVGIASFASCLESDVDIITPLPRLELSADVAEDPSDSASFVAFGDWGTGTESQKAVAAAIRNYCSEQSCDFILSLGDNFYGKGVESVSDPQWKYKFRDIYGPLNLPFYVAAGNHDTYGNLHAQFEYSNIDTNWRMPSEQYTFSWPPETEPLVDFFVVGASRPFSGRNPTQLAADLVNSRAPWKILVRHYPLISSFHFPEEDDRLLEATTCNRIDLVLSGHNHLFSFLRGPKKGCWVEQVIIGTGGAPLQAPSTTTHCRLVAEQAIYGFGWFQATEESLIFRMIDTDGAVVYSAGWKKLSPALLPKENVAGHCQ